MKNTLSTEHPREVAPPPSLGVVSIRSRPVPVLPGTLLSLELMLHQPALDLRLVSQLICQDPGALLHLFAAVTEEGERVPDACCRIEDCIASLPLERLLQRFVNASGIHRDHTAVGVFAHHAVAISHHAQQVADTLDASAEQAMLVGMLHELGFLPWVLGWEYLPCTQAQSARFCAQLCMQYSLPFWLRQALGSLHNNQPGSSWSVVIDAAHELARSQVNVA